MEIAKKENEVPVSAVIIDDNFNIISYAHNKRQDSNDVLGHAEVIAIQEAEKKVKDWRLDGYSIVVSLEPCDMCSIIIEESRLDKVYYLIKQDTNRYNINIDKREILDYQEYKEKAKKLLTSFFDNIR